MKKLLLLSFVFIGNFAFSGNLTFLPGEAETTEIEAGEAETTEIEAGEAETTEIEEIIYKNPTMTMKKEVPIIAITAEENDLADSKDLLVIQERADKICKSFGHHRASKVLPEDVSYNFTGDAYDYNLEIAKKVRRKLDIPPLFHTNAIFKVLKCQQTEEIIYENPTMTMTKEVPIIAITAEENDLADSEDFLVIQERADKICKSLGHHKASKVLPKDVRYEFNGEAYDHKLRTAKKVEEKMDEWSNLTMWFFVPIFHTNAIFEILKCQQLVNN